MCIGITTSVFSKSGSVGAYYWIENKNSIWFNLSFDGTSGWTGTIEVLPMGTCSIEFTSTAPESPSWTEISVSNATEETADDQLVSTDDKPVSFLRRIANRIF